MERPSHVIESGAGAIKPARCRGRPRGTNYRGVDARLHEKMRHLIEDGLAPSRTAAAKQVLEQDQAFGSGTLESKVARLVRTFQN